METRERVACRFKRSQDFNGVFNVIGQRQSAGSDEPVRLDSQWVVRPHAADPQGERIGPDLVNTAEKPVPSSVGGRRIVA